MLDSSASDALPRYRCHPRLPYRHHLVRLALPILAEVAERLFPRWSKRSLVGHRVFHSLCRDEHPYRNRHSCPRLQWKLRLSPSRSWIPAGANHYLHSFSSPLFSRGDVHSLRTDGATFRPANPEADGWIFPDPARASRRCPCLRYFHYRIHCSRYRRGRVHSSDCLSYADLHVRRRDDRRHLD